MKPTIVVSSNCQTAGIAAGMRQFFPSHEITPLAITEKEPRDEFFLTGLQNAELWFTISNIDVVQRLNLSDVHVVAIPEIVFDAFHPDLTYALNSETNTLTEGHYNSTIAVWAYNHRLGEHVTSTLYNAEVFNQLGYYERWRHSTQHLKTLVESCNFDFHSLFLYIKRRGAFMYSINHPKQYVLTRIAQMAASKVNMRLSKLVAPLEVVDAYTDTQWPVYPDIGDFYSVPSSYFWKLGNEHIDGLVPYLSFAFKRYDQEGIRPGNLKIGNVALAERCDKVLPGFLL